MTNKNTNFHSLPSPDNIHIFDLPNGIRLLTRPNFHSQSVVCLGYLPAGSISEPDDKLGLAFFTASALMTGTKRQDFKTLYNTIESLGAHLTFHSGTQT
ncbi:MAG: insulinase family protein, partial [Anaerolineaceae bacterium]|nr:insulinase family protein [Anaerolineaceae bacterium]